MNKIGQEIWATFLTLIIIAIFLIGGTVIFSSFFLNSGQSTDVAYGVEHNPFWYKLYLKDDHKTVYCIDKSDVNLISLAETATKLKQTVKVTYQEYLIKGTLCSAGDNYKGVVVKNIEIIK